MAYMSALLLVVIVLGWEILLTLIVLKMLNSGSVPIEGVRCFLFSKFKVLNFALGQMFSLELKGVELQLFDLVCFILKINLQQPDSTNILDFQPWMKNNYIYLLLMKTNMKTKNNPKAQIIKNKDHYYLQQNHSQQLWASNRVSHTPSRSEMQDRSFSLDINKLLHIFTEHYMMVQSCFKQIGHELTRMESKLADCYGKFNEIQWKLNRQMHEIHQSKSLNESLKQINKEIEEKLALVKNDYEQLKKRRYISGMEKKIDELKESVHKMELQCYRSKFNKQDVIAFEDNLDRLQEIIKSPSYNRERSAKIEIITQIVTDLITFLKSGTNISVWIQQKIRENIDLKCQILKNQIAGQ